MHKYKSPDYNPYMTEVCADGIWTEGSQPDPYEVRTWERFKYLQARGRLRGNANGGDGGRHDASGAPRFQGVRDLGKRVDETDLQRGSNQDYDEPSDENGRGRSRQGYRNVHSDSHNVDRERSRISLGVYNCDSDAESQSHGSFSRNGSVAREPSRSPSVSSHTDLTAASVNFTTERRPSSQASAPNSQRSNNHVSTSLQRKVLSRTASFAASDSSKASGFSSKRAEFGQAADIQWNLETDNRSLQQRVLELETKIKNLETENFSLIGRMHNSSTHCYFNLCTFHLTVFFQREL